VSPLFQVMFAYQNLPAHLSVQQDGESSSAIENTDLSPALAGESIVVDGDSAKFDLSLYLRPCEGGMRGIWQYRDDKFDAGSIAIIAEHFNTILESIGSNPALRLTDIPLRCDPVIELSPINHASHTAVKTPPLLVQALTQQAKNKPLAPALRSSSGQSNYGELLAKVNQLTNHLIEMNIGPGKRVGILLPRNESLLIAPLAVMATGAAYLPLDCAYPKERLRDMLSTATADLIIVNSKTQSMLIDTFRQGHRQITELCLDQDRESISSHSTIAPSANICPDDPAYIIFTSGSTGTPKGVVISHGNLAHYIATMSGELNITAQDKFLHTASFSFSSSIRQFALALTNGAEVMVAGTEQIRNIASLLDTAREWNATIIDLVPTLWQASRKWLELSKGLNNDYGLPQLRLMLSASEPLPGSLANSLIELWPHAQLINMYGQTETAGIVAIHKVPGKQSDSGIVALGHPIGDTKISLRDKNSLAVPIGAIGEICIDGPCVGLGYLSPKDLTTIAFNSNDGCNRSETRGYRTGDLGRYRSDGTLEFAGRTDTQIKHRGFRIEPGDIESVAMAYSAITDAAVQLIQDDSAGESAGLQLFYCTAQHQHHEALEQSALRAHFKERLPAYMIPIRMTQVDALPRNVNGKLNRHALEDLRPQTSRFEEEAIDRADTKYVNDEQSVIDALTCIWQEVLLIDQVGLNDNFFDLGGNSISSIEIVSAAIDANLDLSLDQLFQHQTIQELAAVILTEAKSPARLNSKTPSEKAGQSPQHEPSSSNDDRKRFDVDSLRVFSLEVLENAGLSTEGALILTEVQLESSLRGQATHNIGDIPRYAKRLANGVLNARPNIQISKTTSLSATINGDNAPGQWVASVAIDTAVEMAELNGVGIVSVNGSNHYGAAGHYAWQASLAGMIGICFTNGPVILAPTGGITPLFGNNPIAIGIPCAARDPIVLDMAMSVATRGKIGLTVAEGMPLQAGWILDKLGLPTTRLEDLAAGLAAPIGGHKGYGLAFAIEALAGALSGSGYCSDHSKEAAA
ncbi:MAG: amino acid adenylation domain-containing protein, partial [Pseudomonadales bacterium]